MIDGGSVFVSGEKQMGFMTSPTCTECFQKSKYVFVGYAAPDMQEIWTAWAMARSRRGKGRGKPVPPPVSVLSATPLHSMIWFLVNSGNRENRMRALGCWEHDVTIEHAGEQQRIHLLRADESGRGS